MKPQKIVKFEKKRKGILRHVDEDFAKLLDEVKKQRVILGKDDPNHIKPDWRITLGMVRHPAMRDKILKDLIDSELN